MHKGAAALLWGEPAHDACQRLWLAAQRVPAWGEPARPGFPPEGETGKGASKFLAAAGYFRLGPGSRESGPDGYAFGIFLQRFKATWMRSPHSN